MKKLLAHRRGRMAVLIVVPATMMTSLLIEAPAEASTITATIGCSAGVVSYSANGTGLPKSAGLDIYIDRWATGTNPTRGHRTQNTSSTGSISLPRFSGPTMAITDFDDEYVKFVFQRGSTFLGSASASTPTCNSGGGSWGIPTSKVEGPAYG